MEVKPLLLLLFPLLLLLLLLPHFVSLSLLHMDSLAFSGSPQVVGRASPGSPSGASSDKLLAPLTFSDLRPHRNTCF